LAEVIRETSRSSATSVENRVICLSAQAAVCFVALPRGLFALRLHSQSLVMRRQSNADAIRDLSCTVLGDFTQGSGQPDRVERDE
jgi:hypothetical protein